MSKPIDQERADFEAWRIANFCGGHERLKKCSNAPAVYYYTAEQEAWKVWQARASVQPAGGAVPEGWKLVEKTTCYVLMDGNRVVASLAGPSADDDARIIAKMLAAAPHPVSGEQTVDQHNAAYWQEQYDLLRKDYQRSLDERAQKVAGLVEALEQFANDDNWCYDTCNISRDIAKQALAAQQGEQP